MPAITSDYHMHTPRCKHAAGPMEAYIERAIALGLREIGFSDHNPLPNGYGSRVRMDERELDDYVADVLRLRERYRGAITVRLGIEMDYVAGIEDYLENQARQHPWDYVIGSVHYLDRECKLIAWPQHVAGDAIHETYARYYQLVGQMAQAGWYDIVAHFDLAKRSGHPATERESPLATAALQAIKVAGISMEINTSGVRHPELTIKESYPTRELVAEAIALGIPICVNSDSHAPGHVGEAFDSTAAMLRELGCRELATFANRRRTMVPLV